MDKINLNGLQIFSMQKPVQNFGMYENFETSRILEIEKSNKNILRFFLPKVYI